MSRRVKWIKYEMMEKMKFIQSISAVSTEIKKRRKGLGRLM